MQSAKKLKKKKKTPFLIYFGDEGPPPSTPPAKKWIFLSVIMGVDFFESWNSSQKMGGLNYIALPKSRERKNDKIFFKT